jgi:ribose transport system substrate-binding protein
MGGRYRAVLALAAALAVGGCGEESDAPAESSAQAAELKSIAYAGVADANPQFKGVGDILQSLGEEQGIKVSRFDNKFDAEAALQNAQLMVRLDPDVFMDWSATADANAAIGKQFARAGKPCIALNIPIEGCAWFNHRNSQMGVEEGRVAAAEVKERGWAVDEFVLLLVNFPAAGPEINSLPQNFYSTFAQEFPEMQPMAPEEITPTTTKIGDNAVLVDGQAALQPTHQVVRQALQTIPASKKLLVLVLNDDSGLGALRALQQADRIDDTLIVSNAADPNGIEQLRKNPNWIAEGSVFFGLWPKYLIAMAKAMVDGVEPPELTQAPQLVLTKENLDEYYAADGEIIKDPPVAAPSAYLEEYGLE